MASLVNSESSSVKLKARLRQRDLTERVKKPALSLFGITIDDAASLAIPEDTQAQNSHTATTINWYIIPRHHIAPSIPCYRNPAVTDSGEEHARTMTTTRRGFPLVAQQFKALLKKNLLLSWRNKRASLLQLLSPLMFIFLIFAIDKAIEAQTSTSSTYESVTDPPPEPSPPITPCEDKFFVKTPCYDFVWSGDQSPKFRTIVDRIMNNNPGRRIPPSKAPLISLNDKIKIKM
ncbi:ABC transporter A family member 11 [Spatholobus suberectus]|nr:ABC transporter A family member 11 [Spatholobus suberectus]